MYNIVGELSTINQNYGLVGFKQNDGYIFYGNLKLNHKYNDVVLKNELYISMFVPFTFPEELPVVKDIEKKIDNQFHKNDNDVLCLACDTEMFLDLKSRQNVTICDFIERYLLPYLYSYTYNEKYGKVPFGDRSHGTLGIIEFYKDYFELENIIFVYRFLEYMALKKYRGHNLCLCGSGKKLRNCHGIKVITLIKKVGIDNILNDYNKCLEEINYYKHLKNKQRILEYKKMNQKKRLDYYLFPPKSPSPFEISIPKFYERFIRKL